MSTRPSGSSGIRCTEGMRHWFTYYGQVGTSSPVCRKCGAPNWTYDPNRDPYAGGDRDG